MAMPIPLRALIVLYEQLEQQQLELTLDAIGFEATTVDTPAEAVTLILNGEAPFSVIFMDIDPHSLGLYGILAAQTLQVGLGVECMIVGLSNNDVGGVDFKASLLDHLYGNFIIDVPSLEALITHLIRESSIREALEGRIQAPFNVRVLDNDRLLERLFTRLGCNTKTCFDEVTALELINEQPNFHGLHVINMDSPIVTNTLRSSMDPTIGFS